MAFRSFVAALLECGRVTVPAPQSDSLHSEADEVRRLLDERGRALALNFSREPPALDLEVALWAARQMYRASQLAIYRELNSGAIEQLLGDPCPQALPAARHWSVDLTFVFLPDLLLLARSASREDPLVTRLFEWAAAWPLSSVGIPGVCPQNVSNIAVHDGLLKLYVDRILAKKDWSRLKDPAVQVAAATSLGAYLQEWPDVAKALEWQRPA